MSDEINKLIAEKQALIVAHENKQVEDAEYFPKLVKLEEDIKALTEAEVKAEEEKNLSKVMSTEPKVEKPKKERKLRGIHKGSIAETICDVLQLKTTKNLNNAVEKVVAKLPKVDKKRALAQIKATIRDVKNKKGHWKNFTWKEEEFLLVSNE